MAETIKANGIDMAYRLEGPEGAPVVTMSHSLMANHAMWDAQMAALAGAYRVLRYDTRGHGSSEATAGAYSLGLLAEDAVALLGALGIEKTHFVGLSMGGMIAQMIALDHPHVLNAVVLCDTASGYAPDAASLWRERIEGA